MKVVSLITFILIYSNSLSAKDLIFPSKLQGAWDLNGCVEKYSDMRITISATQIEYWESIGTLQSLTQNKDGSYGIKLNMSGEGFNWIINDNIIIKNKKLVQTSKRLTNPIIRIRCK